jgi:type I restriction enzyme R subunit
MLTESDTRAKLIDPAIHKRGWTEDLIRREETAGAIEIGDNGPRRRSRGRVDYVLRIKATPDSQPNSDLGHECAAGSYRQGLYG